VEVTEMSLVVHADFGSPACYLASRRADVLGAAGVPVDWRAVDADPRLPMGGGRTDVAERDAVDREFDLLDRLLLPGEELPRSARTFRPNTRGAVSGYAEAYEAGVADDVRRLLFTAYWVHGADIGSPETLRRLLAGPLLRGHSTSVPVSEFGYVVSSSRGPITTDAFRLTRDWSSQWETLQVPTLPLLVVDGRLAVSGETALRRLEKEIRRVGARIDPGLPDPGRYPAVDDRPASSWVSENGGRWRHSWMAGA
jgi:predicted DsbA family dithiol-disulfide isomerase